MFIDEVVYFRSTWNGCTYMNNGVILDEHVDGYLDLHVTASVLANTAGRALGWVISLFKTQEM